MEVKGVFPKKLADGTVHLTLSKTAREAMRCQTLEDMWKKLDSGKQQPCTPEDVPSTTASDEAFEIPAEHAWRVKVRSAVRDTTREIAERAGKRSRIIGGNVSDPWKVGSHGASTAD